MIDSETLRKIEQARDLLAEAREAIKEGDGGPLGYDERHALTTARDAIHLTSRALADATVVWERLGKPEAQRAPRITWKPGRFAEYRGAFAGLDAFSIHWHSRREDPNYYVRAHLPGVTLQKKGDDLGALQEACEAALEAWLLRIGGAS
jgi:hypothetical protein